MSIHLQGNIRPELWAAIANSYGAGSYTNAIKDAMLYLTERLREKSDSDTDGTALVNHAFGGTSPTLRINKLETATEKSEQDGFLFLLRGMYQAIRNPRSHETIADNLDETNSIILFINYVLSVIDRSKADITFESWRDLICEQHFVSTEPYANHLVRRVPTRKLFDWVTLLYSKRDTGFIQNIGLVIKSAIHNKHLNENQISDLLTVIARDLETAKSDEVVCDILKILPPEQWPNIDPIAKLRTENRVLKSIREVTESKRRRKGGDLGALATWAVPFTPYFESKTALFMELMHCLSQDQLGQDFIASHFWTTLHLFTEITTFTPDNGSEMDAGKLFGSSVSIPIIAGHVGIYQLVINLDWTKFPKSWRASLADKVEPLRKRNPELFFLHFEPFQTNRKSSSIREQFADGWDAASYEAYIDSIDGSNDDDAGDVWETDDREFQDPFNDDEPA